MSNSWLKFEWDLTHFSSADLVVPTSYTLRESTSDDRETIYKTASSTLKILSDWSPVWKHIESRIPNPARPKSESCPNSRALVLQHGTRIIGTSVFCPGECEEFHLTTGPCILSEYQSRGLGSLLLQASLAALKDTGLKSAFGVAQGRTTAARYVYPKFGGIPQPWSPNLPSSTDLAA